MFEYKGGQYTYEDLQLEAKKQGVEFNDFMEKMKGLGMTYGSNAPDKGLNLDMSSQQPFGQPEKVLLVKRKLKSGNKPILVIGFLVVLEIERVT